MPDPAEVQTYSLRTKGLLIWNQLNQIAGAYTTWVDAIALEKIGGERASPFLLCPDHGVNLSFTLQAYYFIVYMPLVIIQWILIKLFMVETHGFTLEEITLAFGGQDAVIPTIDRVLAEQDERGRRTSSDKGDVESK